MGYIRYHYGDYSDYYLFHNNQEKEIDLSSKLCEACSFERLRK